MTLRHVHGLRAIDTIARLGSIRKAADALHVVPSALARRVQDLEEELGAALFERRARGVRLTAAGEVFVRYCRDALHDAELLRSRLEDLRGLRAGSVSICAIEAVAASVLPAALTAFRARHPRVTFSVRIAGADDVVRAVVADDALVGITFNPSLQAGFRAIAEVAQDLHVLMSKQHPLARRRGALRLRDCLAYPIAVGDLSLGGRVLLEQHLARASLSLEPVLVSSSVELIKATARVSDMLGFQISAGVEKLRPGDGLVARPLADPGLRGAKLIVGVHRNRTLPVAAAVFVETLKDTLLGSGRT